MNTVHRARGFRFSIFVADHDPPHVHVVGDGFAKIVLVGSGGRPEIVYSKNMRAGDLGRALREVEANRAVLLASWRHIHG